MTRTPGGTHAVIHVGFTDKEAAELRRYSAKLSTYVSTFVRALVRAKLNEARKAGGVLTIDLGTIQVSLNEDERG